MWQEIFLSIWIINLAKISEIIFSGQNLGEFKFPGVDYWYGIVAHLRKRIKVNMKYNLNYECRSGKPLNV
jgi:hypothetical protein